MASLSNQDSEVIFKIIIAVYSLWIIGQIE